MGDIIDELTHEQLLKLEDRMAEARERRFRDEPLENTLTRIYESLPIKYADGLQSIYENEHKLKPGRYEMVSVTDVLGNKAIISLEAPPAGRAGYYTADDLRTIARTLNRIADKLCTHGVTK